VPATGDDSRWSNVTPGIASKIGRNLHQQPGHPLFIIKRRIAAYFDRERQRILDEARAAGASESEIEALRKRHSFILRDDLSPHVTTKQNFDELLFEQNHPGRSPSDTFYYSKSSLLRTHTSAHQSQLLRDGLNNFLVVGDCYRRDEIDASHYPVFHQMEGVRVFRDDPTSYDRSPRGEAKVVEDLKTTLEGLIRSLFGAETKIRWVDAYFPFTHPSFEMEIWFQDKWMEVLGCGVIQHRILDESTPVGADPNAPVSGWAFGLGLERLAMILFSIPDIRLFWSEDARFIQQFTTVQDEIDPNTGAWKKVTFQPFSKYPPCFKDVSFWIPEEQITHNDETGAMAAGGDAHNVTATTSDTSSSSPSSSPCFHENDLMSLVREIGGDLVESVSCIDSFQHPKTKQTSKCYRICYRALDRNLRNEEVDELQEKVREGIQTRMGFKLR